MTDKATDVTVTQADRDEAAPFATGFGDLDGYSFSNSYLIRNGRKDDHALVQAFARHRTASEQPASGEGALGEALFALSDRLRRSGFLSDGGNHAAYEKVVAAFAALSTTSEAPDNAERCRKCGHGNPSWSAPSPLWNAVMRGGSIDGAGLYNDMVCPACFIDIAVEKGIATGWRLEARQVNVPLETVTPSGRVWDAARYLWVDPDDVSEAPEAGRLQGWDYVATCPMWTVAIVTDGESVAIAQKAETDFDGYYWAVDPEDALDWEPTHWIERPAALSPCEGAE